MGKKWRSLNIPAVDVGLMAFAAVLTASLALNVKLGLYASAKPPVFAETGFGVGMHLPDVKVVGPESTGHRLRFTRNTLLYVFSPVCEWSKGDYANLTAVARAASDNYDVIGLYATPYDTPEEVREYLTNRPFPGQVIAVDLETAGLPDDQKRRFGSTPQLLVVAPGGLVRRAWTGALFGQRQAEAEGYFGLRLPGVNMVGGVAGPALSAVDGTK